MPFSKISLINFRNYKTFHISIDAKCILILGPNGSGKTNLLEAISLLNPGKGLRNASFSDIINKNVMDASNFTVSSNYLYNNQNIRIGTQYKNMGKRLIKVNENHLNRQIDILEYLRIVWLTPQMDGIFISSNSLQRNFFDKIVYTFFPEHSRSISKYEHLMRERNIILSTYDGSINSNKWLNGIEASMANLSLDIIKTREEGISILSRYLSNLNLINIKIEINGECEELYYRNQETFKENIIKKFRESRSIDSRAKKTLFGIHRTNFTTYNTTKGIPGNLCSTGEQKLILISIILSQAKAIANTIHSKPILLLDEIFSHIDKTHREYLIDQLYKMDLQFWISSTEDHIGKEIKDIPCEIETIYT